MMMSIVEQFGGKGRRQEPVLPARSAIPPTNPHEKTAQALLFVTRLNEEVEQLREENARLRAELNVAMMRNRDLEQMMAVMRSDMEAYRRYSVEVKTHLQHIVDAANRANEAALEAGETGLPDKDAAKVVETVEREVRDRAEELGARFGSGGVVEPQHG